MRRPWWKLWAGAALFAVGLAAGYFWPAPAELATRPAQPATAARPATGAAWDRRLGFEPRLVDVAAAAGIDFRHTNGATGRCQYLEIMGGGVALFDYDGDGRLDIYLVNGNHLDQPPDPAITNRLYRNLGNWVFGDVTGRAGVGDAGYGQGCATGDYDGDGDLDLYVTNFGPNLLYRNNGDGTFTDVSAEAGVADDGWGQCAAFCDFDGDGRLDLYVQNYLDPAAARSSAESVVGPRQTLDYPSPLGKKGARSRMYRNLGQGRFRDVTVEAGLDFPDGKGMGLTCADFDGDRRVDLFVANDSMENYLFRQRADGRFEEVGQLWGVAYDAAGTVEASMGVDAADYDHDGDLDLVVPCLARQIFSLYRNDARQFTDVASMSGLGATGSSTGFDGHFLDYDNDGDLDLLFTCGGVRRNEGAAPEASFSRRYGMPDLLLANDGRGRFRDVSPAAGPYFREALVGRGSAVGDLDNDGDLDVVISNLNDRVVVLRNDTVGGHWLTLDLVDSAGQRNPPGVSVWITSGGRRQHAVAHPATSYLSQSDRRLHFGLGRTCRVEKLEIRWPGGSEQIETDVRADRIHVLRQRS